MALESINQNVVQRNVAQVVQMAEAIVARMERSAIRVIVSGAGKSRISLRFMRATD